MNSFYELSADSKFKIFAPTIIGADDYLENCDQCGSVYSKKAFESVDLIIEGKGEFPDILLCGHWPLLLLAERALTIWNEKNFRSYTAFPVRLFRKYGNDFDECSQKYFNIIINGRCDLDFEKMGVKVKNVCGQCGTVFYNKETWEFDKPVLKEKSWDNSQVFVANGFTSAPICTIDVLKVVFNNKLRNFRFSRLEEMFRYKSVQLELKSMFGE